jgi:stringent starvation protein B
MSFWKKLLGSKLEHTRVAQPIEDPDPPLNKAFESTGMQDSPPSKEAVILKLLSEGDMTLCLDACHPGVRVPSQHTNNHALQLILSRTFPYPIDVTAEGVSANLSFGGQRYNCYIPMAAVWAAFKYIKQGTMWPDSMPPEVKANLAVQE